MFCILHSSFFIFSALPCLLGRHRSVALVLALVRERLATLGFDYNDPLPHRAEGGCAGHLRVGSVSPGLGPDGGAAWRRD
jgi:hypothetical protein